MASCPSPLNTSRRRRALGLGLVNGAFWSIGNALSTGSLVSYLARDLGAQGLGLSLVLAAPNLGGVLRVFAPSLIYRARTARRGCLAISLASYLLVATLPLVALLAPTVSRPVAVVAMIVILFVHQTLEYFAAVALWSWFADLVPLPIRGRYFGRRQMLQLAVSIPTLLAGGYFAEYLRDEYKSQPDRLLLAYAIPIALGAVCLLSSLMPLWLMPATRRYPRPESIRWRSLVAAPFFDRQFWPLLIFRSWFSLANGISQVVQNVVYPKDVLGFGVGPMSTMKATTQLGQMGVSRWVGAWSDRIGNRPVLMAAEACVSASLIFYMLAYDADTHWLLLGAWVLFAAYAAHNICLPNLVLKLAPAADTPAYVASNEALGSLFHAVSTVGGGLLFDWLKAGDSDTSAQVYRGCLTILAVGLLMRSLGVVLLAMIQEPGAWTWRELIARSRTMRRDAT